MGSLKIDVNKIQIRRGFLCLMTTKVNCEKGLQVKEDWKIYTTLYLVYRHKEISSWQ